MQKIADFVKSFTNNNNVDSSILKDIQISLGDEMKVDGWVSLLLSNKTYVVLKFNKGVFMNEGYVLNEKKVQNVIDNNRTDDYAYSGESTVEDIADLDYGSRFEGSILPENDGKKKIPFGYGEMYDDNGSLLYKGTMINWKRFGYGTSYHDNGLKEYEGYWCDDNRFGRGKVYDRKGRVIKECEWYNGVEYNINDYEGDGSKHLSIGMKHLKLTDNCVLKDWDVSLFYNLESIEIGDECFELVQTFKIDGLNRLKSLKIGYNSFTEQKDYVGNEESKSFHILNCESLESIEIGRYSFSDFGGAFELKNLPQLQSIQIGIVATDSWNLCCCSCIIRGIERVPNVN